MLDLNDSLFEKLLVGNWMDDDNKWVNNYYNVLVGDWLVEWLGIVDGVRDWSGILIVPWVDLDWERDLSMSNEKLSDDMWMRFMFPWKKS